MTCTLNAEHTVTTLVACLLPRRGSMNMHTRHDPFSPSKALYVSLDLRLSAHQKDETGHTSRIVHLIFERPSNYTKVWAVTDDAWQVPKPEAFTMRSDHDSCWRSDGLRVITEAYSDLFEKLRERNPGCSPSEFCVIHAVQWLSIEYAPVSTADPHVKRITSIKQGRRLDGR